MYKHVKVNNREVWMFQLDRKGENTQFCQGRERKEFREAVVIDFFELKILVW